MKILMCRPDYYGIDYSINPWMNPVKNPTVRDLALEQWDFLFDKINELCDTIVLDGQPNLPDMVFTANAGLVFKNQKRVIISNFFHKERQGEEKYFRRFFEEEGYEVENPQFYFEGAGDALYLKEHLIGGYGFRTNVDSYNEFLFRDYGFRIITTRLTNPYFYHLDTCFCPLNEHGDYLIYPQAVDDSILKKFGRKSIIVPGNEAKKFACNAVVIDNNVIIPEGCIQTKKKLEEENFIVHEIPMSEFIKSGGACKCLTLKIN